MAKYAMSKWFAVPRELEEKTATMWLKSGAIRVDSLGSENTYYVDEFDNRFYCKNYPNPVEIAQE